MKRYLIIGYGAAGYLLFLVATLYAIGFVGAIVVPRNIDHGIDGPIWLAVLVNVALLGLFGIQHSVMARPGFKRWWTRFVPKTVERSTYVLLASAILLLLFLQWRTMPAVIWTCSIRPPGWCCGAVRAGVGGRVCLVVHGQPFRPARSAQVYLAWREKPYTEINFRVNFYYRVVRHPLMLGFIIAFWATPTMTAGHLLFAIVTTAYVLVALPLEERDLVAALGDQYRDYQRSVPLGTDVAAGTAPRLG
ncbi:phospholipid methyltransferase family protein [Mycobacterium ulcerans str. Harvey]|uniref:methanethiol S-methyltransferase n=1 Tax=Mycobacterium ulcerans str. Harvey TaxID=1299332 RepID=A0ABN0QXX0_MYCUL|nr:phospholipid methyltransferase family protein [Mycobacterium ulcerans str. Harvey]